VRELPIYITAIFVAAAFTLIVHGCVQILHTEPAPAPAPAPTTTTTTTTTAPKPTETDKGPYFPLTDWERDLVERVVMAEAGAEPYEGQKAVAQCILNASKLRRMQPAQTVQALKYTKARPEPTESVKQAVVAVFDEGETVFDREVIYFYAPGMVKSAWHETQQYVTTIGGHRFFKEAR
jgi:spore germination cell wall hydrolase CwlJ-like protein